MQNLQMDLFDSNIEYCSILRINPYMAPPKET